VSHDEGVDFCGAFVCVGNSGVGSPILIGDQVVAVLCVSGPTARILDRLDEMAVATRDAAREISDACAAPKIRWSRADICTPEAAPAATTARFAVVTHRGHGL
jgi:hypothetical protein